MLRIHKVYACIALALIVGMMDASDDSAGAVVPDNVVGNPLPVVNSNGATLHTVNVPTGILSNNPVQLHHPKENVDSRSKHIPVEREHKGTETVVERQPGLVQPEDIVELNVPSLIVGSGIGIVANMLNSLTLRGSLYRLRKLVRHKVDYISPEIACDVNKIQQEALKREKALARYAKMSIVRRSAIFRAMLFVLPATAAYDIVCDNEYLKRWVSFRINSLGSNSKS